MLNKLLNKQVRISAWQFGLFSVIIISIVVIVLGLGSHGWHHYGNYYDKTSTSYDLFYAVSLKGLIMVGSGAFLTFGCNIAMFVLWIIGIVNASRIQKITNDSTILIIFSIFVLLFGHMIVAILQRNKFRDSNKTFSNDKDGQRVDNGFETKLKQSFMDGIITSSEFDAKMKEYKSNSKK